MKITVKAPPPVVTSADSRERVAALKAAATALLAVLDAHEDASEPTAAYAYHPKHEDAVFSAKGTLRVALKGSP